MFANVNILPLVVSSIAAIVIGMIWYSKSVFGNAWMKAIGMSEANMKKAQKEGMGKVMVSALVQGAVLAYVLSEVLVWSGATGVQAGFQTAFWIWLGFVATVQLGSVLWEKKSLNYFWINSLYWLVTMMVMSAILVSWPA
jgi:hypothetical protein